MESQELPWTGERLVPTLRGDIVLEHLHRYAIAAELAADRDVLDIACGEGYGSHLLALRARSVVGVDIAPESVRHATAKYVRPNLRFREGSCTAIPLPDTSVDLVVSFETIEHLAEHDQFLAEINRVLRPNGILIISTPERGNYDATLATVNPFHQRELSQAEFEALLRGGFKQVHLLGQRVAHASVVLGQSADHPQQCGMFTGDFRAVEFSQRLPVPTYLLAVCSDAPLPAIPVGDFEFKSHPADGLAQPEGCYAQIFADQGAGYSEAVSARHPLNPGVWQTIRFEHLQRLHTDCRRRLRIDLVNQPARVELASIRITRDSDHATLYDASSAADFARLEGSASLLRYCEGKWLMLLATDADPQIHLPLLPDFQGAACTLEVNLRLETTVPELARRLHELAVDKESLAALTESLKLRAAQLEATEAVLRQFHTEARATLKAGEVERERLLASVAELRADVAKLEAEIATRSQSQTEMSAALEHGRFERERLVEEARAVQEHSRAERERLLERSSEADRELDLARQECQNATGEIAALQAERAELQTTAAWRLASLQRQAERFAARQKRSFIKRQREAADLLLRGATALHPTRRLRKLHRLAKFVRASGLLDDQWYRSQHADQVGKKTAPVLHYLHRGVALGCDPNPFFATLWYLERNPDVAAAGMNPLVHYLQAGWKEGRDPSPRFSIKTYLRDHPDIAAAGKEPLAHYLAWRRINPAAPAPEGKADVQAASTRQLPDHGAAAKAAPKSGLSSPCEEAMPLPIPETGLRLIAFYLPQFHPIPENDRWWGEGFTEWRNVTRGQPLFPGHYQPRLPGALGFYDLRLKEVMRRQIELAQQFGIQGFCFHHYWFGGTRLLERPVEQFLADPELDMPFCLCWANENWTRRWDGEERDVLIEQRHSTDDDLAFIADAVRCFRDPRYIRIGNRPVMVVYRPQILPDPAATARVWRNHCRAQGLDLYLVAAQTFGHSDPRPLGFDAAVQFPPHNFAPEEILKPGLVPNFKGKLYDYEAWGRGFLQPQRPGADYPLFRCVSPDWDNTARRGLRATVFADATPDKYARWLEGACLDALRSHPPERRLVFVNAWNEWAEGACLEPDLRHGYAYLNRTAAVLGRLGQGAGSALPRICLLGHDAARAGAQMVLLHLVRWLKENTNLDLRVVLLGDGPLSPQFAEVAPVLFKGNATDSEAFAAEVLNFCDQRIDLLYGNTAVAARVYDSLAALGVPILTHVHELEASLQRFAGAETIAKLLKHTTHFIAPSPPTAENLHRQHGVSTDKLQVIPEFIAPTGTELPAPEIRAELRRNLGLPETQFVVFGCGTQDWRKGADLFVETARLVRDAGRLDVMFCWIGDGLDDRITHPQELIQRYGLEQQVRFLGLHDNPRELFRVGSLFLLPSREDPFPLVCLEAAECGLPIICFAGAGGMPEFVGPDVGEVVPFEDVNAMAAAVLRLASNPAERDRLGRAARVKLLATHVSATEAPKIMSALRSALAAGRHRQSRSQSSLSVSVVVPNYNYARYLEERLASIKAQTYPLHEIIVLDDASQDESAEVIKRWLHTCATPMMFVGNPENSGSVCAQWRKGLELASGDLVWIAEADDYCEPAFLARLAAAFRDPEVVLAYSQSVPVDAAGKLMPNGFGWSPVADAARAASPGLVYTDTVDCRRWEADYVASGDEEIVLALAQQNTIPNASAVLLRRTAALKAIPAALEFKNCGDWAFYLELARQGRFAYFRADLNYFRRHGGSTTLNQSARVIAEGLAIKRRLADEGRLTANSLLESLCRSFMEYEWESRQAPDRVPMREHPACAAELAQLELSLQRILPSGQHPAFLIILPDAETGGGQTAAIRFANGLARDHRVFLINARPDLDDGHLKQMLDPAVLLLEGRLDSKIHRRFSAETPPRWATDAQPLRVAALASLMRFLRIEVVMSHVWWSDKLAFALTDQATTPWFIHMHGCYEFLLGSQDSDPGFRALAPQILRRADGVFYSHPKNLRVFQELNLPPAPVHRVNTGLADPAPPPAGSAPPFVRRDGDFVFCLCARAIPEKGWEEAMRATQAINQRPAAARGNRRARLVLLGDGPHLQDLLARYPDREQIIPLGLHARPTDVLPFCDAGLLPTRFVSESLPNSVIEYLACGLPVIATQHACIPEMIADHGLTAGLTIPLGTADAVTSALAEAMTQLMTNPDLCARFRTSARELFQRKFEIQACIQTMKAKILSSPPGARR